MDLFYELQSKFNGLDSKIETRKALINDVHNSNTERISQTYNDASINNHLDSINFYRQEKLNEIQTVLSSEITDFNGLASFLIDNLDQNFISRKYKTAQLMIQVKEKDIKDNFLHFNKSKLKDTNQALNKIQFGKAFSFNNICKYSHFLVSKKRFSLVEDLNRIGDLDDNFASKFYSLPLNKIFICTNSGSRTSKKMLILDTSGSALFSRQLSKNYINEEFKICCSYILRIYHEFKGRYCMLNIEIYDFKLNLINTIELDESYGDDVVINRNEFAFENSETKKVLAFNTQTLKSSVLNLQDQNENEPFYIYSRDSRLVHINESKLYFIKYGTMIYIMDRYLGSRLTLNIQTNVKDRFNLSLIKFDNESRLYLVNYDESLIRVYQSDGAYLYNIQFNFVSKWFYFTQFDTVVFNMKFINQNDNATIEFDEF